MQHYPIFKLLADVSPAPARRQPPPPQRILFHTIMSLLAYTVASINPFTKKSKRPYISGTLCNTKFSALFDTGADISCISEKLFRQIPVNNRPQKLPPDPNCLFKSAGGQTLDVKGKYRLPISMQGKNVSHNFYVIKDLNEPAILGIDFITEQKLQFCPQSREFYWQGDHQQWKKGTLKTTSAITLDPLSVNTLKVSLLTETNCRPTTETPCMIEIKSSDFPFVSGGPALIKIDNLGLACVQIQNCAPFPLEIPRGTQIGQFENISNCDVDQINPQYINSVADQLQKQSKSSPCPEDKKKFIKENVTLNVPDDEKAAYFNLLFENHAVFSDHKHDLGRATTLQHEITLKNNLPIYVKQFKIPEAHQQEVRNHVTEWLKLGVIQPSRSKYNSPVFVVAKKDGGLRIVQDFRALNAQSHIDKYSMKDVHECVSEIGQAGSTIFSTIDLTSGFWQMLLDPKSRPYTAFTVPGMGQFEWITSPMGLLGCPASFQRLVEAVVAGLINIIVYIDDLLVHSKTHGQHRKQLHDLFQRLQAHGLKINLKKCVFGSKDVLYLGFRLTEQGIKPGSCKLKAVAQTKPPSNVHEVRQFLGLCNFFRAHVKNFAQVSAPLCHLTKKECKWKNGPLPEEALKSFRALQSILVSEPVVDFPKPDRQYALITDASLGDDSHPGGLGAILTQIDEKGEHRVIAYASRKLQKHEKNYTPFLIEMQAAVWAMDHFYTYLRGRHFTLVTDHRPLEQLGKVHTRTLNRLQEAMNTFDFDILYKKGSEMPADFLSRNAIDAISWEDGSLLEHQNQDSLIRAIKEFLLNRQLPANPQQQHILKTLVHDCFIEDNLVWKRIKRMGEPSRVVIFLPQTLISQALDDAHGSQLGGHDGAYKTKERLLQCYYWPGMDSDILKHIQACHKCQMRKTTTHPKEALLVTPAQCTEPNQRVHADLFGPLRVSGGGKKYILCITDAFTKYVELIALPNKEAVTVATAIFNRWICRYGSPLQLTTDQGSEFMSKVSKELYTLLHINHVPTTSYHPQCNAQCEIVNKTIAKYLASHVENSTLDWELYLAPLMFTYNTSYHKSIKNTPFFLTFGVEPRIPGFPAPELRRKFYGESDMSELHQRLQYAREIARLHNETASETAKHYHDLKGKPHTFQMGQLVLLKETQFSGKNKKLADNYNGPHRIIRLVHENNVELLQTNGRKLLVHVNRLKPYIVPPTKPDFDFPEINWDIPVTKEAPKVPIKIKTEELDEFEDVPIRFPTPFNAPKVRDPTPPPRGETPIQNFSAPDQPPPKRGRGRPRKNPLAPTLQPTIAAPRAVQPTLPQRPVFQGGEGRMTRSKARAAQFMRDDPFERAQDDPFTEDAGPTGPFLPVQDELAAEMIKLVQQQLIEGVKRARKKPKKITWSNKQQKLYRRTGDLYDYNSYKNYSSTGNEPIPDIPVPAAGPPDPGGHLEPVHSDPDHSDSDSSTDYHDIRDSSASDSDATVRRRSPVTDPDPHLVGGFRPARTPPATPKTTTATPIRQPEKEAPKKPNSPAVGLFAELLNLGTPQGARAKPDTSALDEYLNLTSPELNRRAKQVQQELAGPPPSAIDQPMAFLGARPKVITKPKPIAKPKKEPTKLPEIPADPFARSSRLTRSPTQPSAQATQFVIPDDPFAKSSRMTRSPVKAPATSTRSKSSAPDIPLPKVPLERKIKKK